MDTPPNFPIFSVYTYVVTKPEEVTAKQYQELLDGSINMCILSVTKDVSLTYIYDNESQRIHLDTFRGIIGERSASADEKSFYDLATKVLRNGYTISFTTRKKITLPIYFTFINRPNFSAAIDQLEKAGIVGTEKGEFILANDDRKFWYLKTPDEKYQVDCLGTVFCADITDELYEVWSAFFV